MSGEWARYSAEMEELLALEDLTIAVTFTNDELDGGGKKASVCQALKMAAGGESFVLDPETSTCPGGSWHCGLSEPPSGEMARVLQKFLTRGEKLSSTLASLWRMLNLTAPAPTGLAERILIGPARDAEIRPDILIFGCHGEAVCRLLTLDGFWDGIPPKIEAAGSLCHAAIAYPVVTGNTNVSFGDWTARRMTGFRRDLVFVSVPYERMENLIAAVPECSAGTADFEMPPEMVEGSGE